VRPSLVRLRNRAEAEAGGSVEMGFPAARRDEHVIELCDCTIDLTAALFNVGSRELRRTGRTTLGICRVRQIAMYVSHVALGLSMNDIGRGFNRDRTTVLHACHLVEDLREDKDFERVVQTTERVVVAALRTKGLI
jgi:chromosomal replication initiation ATPase DnaA